MSQPGPGWYQDPEGPPGQTRWWDGSQWTENRAAPQPPKPQWTTGSKGPKGPNPWQRFRGLPTWAQVTAWGLFAVLVVAGIAGGGSETSNDSASSDDRADNAPAAAPAKKVKLNIATDDQISVAGKSTVVTGKVSPVDSVVLATGEDVKTKSNGSFRVKVPLHTGENNITLTATRRGYTAASESVFVTRTLTAAERAARAEKRRQKKEAAIANLRASATELDPGQFQKDPDRYAGQKVVMRGEVLQIQEGGDNFLIMTTGCETEYEVSICDGPEVYVGYGFDTDKAEDSMVTVYGTVVGGKEYETTIGGSNFVGELKARIIE